MEKLTHDSKHVVVHGHRGKWYVVDNGWFKKNGDDPIHVFLMEHETYGDTSASVIVDEDANLIMEDVFNGFSDLEDDGWKEVCK